MQAKIVGLSTGEDRWGRPLPDGEVEYTLVVRVKEDSREDTAMFDAHRARAKVTINIAAELPNE